MSEVELGSVISMILENPELVAQIKRMAESKEEKETSVVPDTPGESEITASVEVKPPAKPRDRVHTASKRGELLHALAPYISEGRQKALETFMTIADILDMMREK